METPKLQESRPNVEIQMVEGGHMMYQKCIVQNDDGTAVFIKEHHPELFTDDQAEAHTKRLLEHEAKTYATLQQVNFPHIPEHVAFENDALFLTAHLPEDGWHWELPKDPLTQERYVEAVLHALGDLESLPTINTIANPHAFGPLDELYVRGWQKLEDEMVRGRVLQKLYAEYDNFLPHVQSGANKLISMFEREKLQWLHETTKAYLRLPREYIGHFDARQPNITWHPEHGVRLVDWSWSAATTLGSDRTMFIIDLFKSGYDVSGHKAANFDHRHAILQLGNWLGRSIMPAAPGDGVVRFHQLASAVSAATLVLN